VGGIAGGDNPPGQNTSRFDKGFDLIRVKDESIKIQIGIEIDDIHARGQYQGPVGIGADMNPRQTPGGMNGRDHFIKAGDDLFF